MKLHSKISIILALLTAVSAFLGLTTSGLAYAAGGGGIP